MPSLTQRQIIGEDPIVPVYPNGCFNRGILAGSAVVQDGYAPAVAMGDGWIRRDAAYREIPDPMSKDCQYTLRKPDDAGCRGCKWRAQT